MIERKFVAQKLKEYQIEEFVTNTLERVGHSHTKVQRTPLGEKIIIYASRPGLVVGRGGQNIKKLTKTLKKKFGLENPQIEINEIENINLDANIISEKIANSLERFGTSKFKGIGHKTMGDVMNAGALGVEILISGKIPGSRAKRWRFYQGYLKKCGDIAITGINTSYNTANLKTGTIGIQVRVMPPDIELPDKIEILEEKQEIIEEVKDKGKAEEVKEGEEKPKEVKEEKAAKGEPKKKEKAAKKAEKKESKKPGKTVKKNGNNKEKGTKSNEQE